MATDEQKSKVKQMLVEQLRLRMKPEEIVDADPLFGEEGLGLDSVDAIELVAGIEAHFGVVVPSEQEARDAFGTLETLTDYLVAKGGLG